MQEWKCLFTENEDGFSFNLMDNYLDFSSLTLFNSLCYTLNH